MQKLLFSFPCLFLISFSSIADNVTSNCSWKPAAPVKIESLTRIPEEKAEWQKRADNDYAKILNKGRTYFHSLPDSACKTGIFIVRGDVIEIIDSYPEKAPKFTRVRYYSSSMKKEIMGWIEGAEFCRLTESGAGC